MYKKLEIRNLTVSSKDTVLVKNINLSFEQGVPLILLGESGSGKSLIIDTIMGSLSKDLEATGEILLDGVDLLKFPLKKRRALWGKEIALLPQEPWRALDPTMKIVEQVSEVHEYIHKDKKNAKEKALKDLDDVSLKEFANSYPFEISGGMCQRTTIAITHAFNSQVLLADEPTKGLDKELCTQVSNRLNKEVEENRLLFVITHDIDIAKNIKGNLGIIVDGELIEYGKSDKLFANPKHEYTQRLFKSQSSLWEIEKPENISSEIIEVKNLSKEYGENRLFKDLNFKLKKGEITSVVGRSGSGKSTLGDILLGVKNATNGEIIKSQALDKLKFQKIYQQPPSAFLPNQTLKEGFEDLVKLHKLNMNKVYELLKKVNLDQELLYRKPHEVSGGELQRIAIVKVLLLKPAFIFADEATSRLDSISQQEVIYLLIDIVKKEKLSLLLVTHDLEIAQKISNNIIYLK